MPDQSIEHIKHLKQKLNDLKTVDELLGKYFGPKTIIRMALMELHNDASIELYELEK